MFESIHNNSQILFFIRIKSGKDLIYDFFDGALTGRSISRRHFLLIILLYTLHFLNLETETKEKRYIIKKKQKQLVAISNSLE
jgi:hypothetical protein